MWRKNPQMGYRGYVTRFLVRKEFLDHHEVRRRVGGRVHEEYWIPAEKLEALNDNIVGTIEVIATLRGDPPSSTKPTGQRSGEQEPPAR